MSEPKRPNDRRLHRRFSVEGKIQLGPGKEDAAILRNLSMSGLSCLSPVRFEDMTLLEITMALPGPDGEVPFKVNGAVVRCEPDPDGNGHSVAIFFTHMDDENRRVLEAFIREQPEV